MSTLEEWLEAIEENIVLRSEYDELRFQHTVFIIVVSTVLVLMLILLVIVYAWLYKVEKKLKESGTNLKTNLDYRIRRAQIREEFPNKPQPSTQNPLSRSPNFTAVVDDLNKRTPNSHPSQPTRLPGYISDNNNFIY